MEISTEISTEIKEYLDVIGNKKNSSIRNYIIRQDNVGLATFYLQHLNRLHRRDYRTNVLAYMNYLATAYPSTNIYMDFVQYARTFSAEVYSKEIVIKSNAVNLLENLKNVQAYNNNNNYFELKVEDLILSIKTYIASKDSEGNSTSKRRRLSSDSTTTTDTDMRMINFLLKSLKNELEENNVGVLASALVSGGKDTKLKLDVVTTLLNSNITFNTEEVVARFLLNMYVHPDELQLAMVKLLIENFKHVVEKDEFHEINMVFLHPGTVSKATFLYLNEKINKQFKIRLSLYNLAHRFGDMKYSDMGNETNFGSGYLERVKILIQDGRVTLLDGNIDEVMKDNAVESDDDKRELVTWYKSLKSDGNDGLKSNTLKLSGLKY